MRRAVWTVRLGLATALAGACLAASSEAAEAAPKPFVSEARMEFILDHYETPVGTFTTPLCLGIGPVRGVKVLRYRRFVCSATIEPDAHIIIRTSLSPRGRVVFG
jgi:hypothetical protein